jgi:hypothetical protein
MTISQFIELAMMLMTRFILGPEVSVSAAWYKPVAAKYGIDTIERFLNNLSADIDTLRSVLAESHESAGKVSYEVYEKTPLRRFPLLRVGTICHKSSGQAGFSAPASSRAGRRHPGAN